VILDHPAVRRLLDLTRPVGLLMVSVLHFVRDDEEAYAAVAEYVDALAPGGYLAVTHAAAEAFTPLFAQSADKFDVYRQRTPTPGTSRTRERIEPFFAGLELLDPGVVRLGDWWPDPAEQVPAEDLELGGPQGAWAGVARKP
jgi:hypothetical protein